jgi:hypothetical protein
VCVTQFKKNLANIYNQNKQPFSSEKIAESQEDEKVSWGTD